jgi:hypothetical protein
VSQQHTSRRRFLAAAGSTLAVAVAFRRIPVLAGKKRKKRPADLLFRDRFKRQDRKGWGAPWFNQRFDRAWSVKDRTGFLRLPPPEKKALGYRPNPVLVLDHDVVDLEVRATFMVSDVSGRVGVLARAVGYADHYSAYLGPGNVLKVTRGMAHRERILGKRVTGFKAGRRYHIRLSVTGGSPPRVRAKAWPKTGREPSEWMVDVNDTATSAITGPGAFGVITQHANKEGLSVRFDEVSAHSLDTPAATRPEVTYSIVGPPNIEGKVKLVAKTAIPAEVGFEIASEPTFTQDVSTILAGRTSAWGLTAKSQVALPQGLSGLVYWRAFAQRRGEKVFGPAASFRAPPPETLPVRFAFGSCTRWKPYPHGSFEQARLRLPDFYLHQGDFGYARANVAFHGPDTYQDHWTRMLMDPHLSSLTQETPFTMVCDDEDYGTNNADRRTWKRFVDRAHRELNANPGNRPYFEFRWGDVAVFQIDCRRFSTGQKPPPEKRSKLGSEQKQWLFTAMERAVKQDAALLVVSSPQAFGSDKTPASWRRGFQHEWSELIDFFQGLGEPVLIVSGDAHGHRLHEYPQKNIQPHVPRIVEINSSGTEQNKFSYDVDPDVLLQRARGSGFGLVELGPEEDTLGQRTRQLTLTALRSEDGTPFWTARYVVVRGVGLVPARTPLG